MKNNKKGSMYLEATMVMPLSIIICISLIYISLNFYNEIVRQVESHKQYLEEANYLVQLEILRYYEDSI